jgi:hypothetical protein
MQTAQEIVSNLKNLRYYADKVAELASKQFQLDHDKSISKGVNPLPGSIRFDCLAVIIDHCTRINTYCNQIEMTLKSAIVQDKTLYDERYIEQTALELE